MILKTYTIIKTTALILALITVSIATAAAISCDGGDICVNDTGWWRDGGAFNASGTPIQDAVDDANAGEAICVKAGSYAENVDVTTAHLTLAGEGADVVTVTAADSGDHVFEVTVNYVNISGFNLTGTTWPAGICLNGADHCNISNNTASNKDGSGIELWYSSDNTLAGNTANSNYYGGIYLESSSNNTLIGNTASNNDYHGIYIVGSNDNTLENNAANSNQYSDGYYSDGIRLDSSSDNILLNNTALNNAGDGIGLYDSSSNTLTGNTALQNYGGIYLDSSSNNTLLNNTASNNNGDGIYLWKGSSGNLIYNNYLDNTNNACDDGSNQWNATIITAGQNIIGGPSICGNYWSDYNSTDTDGDGLGEKPYNITDGSNFDYHPLCSPEASVKGDLNGDGDLTSADATIALRLAATGAHDDAADVSADGQVTSLDALMILQAATEIIEL